MSYKSPPPKKTPHVSLGTPQAKIGDSLFGERGLYSAPARLRAKLIDFANRAQPGDTTIEKVVRNEGLQYYNHAKKGTINEVKKVTAQLESMFCNRETLRQYEDALTEVFTIPNHDPREALRGQKGLRAKVDIPHKTILGIYSGYLMPGRNWLFIEQLFRLTPYSDRYFMEATALTVLQTGEITQTKNFNHSGALVISGAHNSHSRMHNINANTIYPEMLNEAAHQNKRARNTQPPENDIDANVVVYSVSYYGIVYVIFCTEGEVAKGDELLFNYGRKYWEMVHAHEKLAKDSANALFEDVGINACNNPTLFHRLIQTIPNLKEKNIAQPIFAEDITNGVGHSKNQWNPLYPPPQYKAQYPKPPGQNSPPFEWWHCALFSDEKYNIIPLGTKEGRYGLLVNKPNSSQPHLIIWFDESRQPGERVRAEEPVTTPLYVKPVTSKKVTIVHVGLPAKCGSGFWALQFLSRLATNPIDLVNIFQEAHLGSVLSSLFGTVNTQTVLREYAQHFGINNLPPQMPAHLKPSQVPASQPKSRGRAAHLAQPKPAAEPDNVVDKQTTAVIPATPTGTKECLKCGKEIKLRYEDMHKESHEEKRRHLCNVEGCGAAFAESDSLTKHTRTHTGEKPYKCSFEGCDAAFAESCALTRHTRTHTGEKPYKCTFEGCSAAFAQSGALTAHTRSHTGEKTFKCTFEGCSAAFAGSDTLTKHTRTHTGEKPFKCTFKGCGAAFAQSGSLTAHTRSHTGEKPFKCTFKGCGAAFAQSGALTDHTRTHTGEKPFKCTVEGCHAAFAKSGGLQAHTRRHTGEKPYKCTFEGCGAAFAESSALTAHTRTHTGEKPFKCTFEGCGVAFAQSSGLSAHTRRHTGEKPYKCTVEGCGAAFAESGALKRHTRTHTGEKPYKCTFKGCGAAFAVSGNLGAHAKTHTRK